MYFPTSSDLDSANESSALIALVWQEMFDADTPDSYRPRLFDTHFLVSELAGLTTLPSRDARWKRHVKLVQGEVRQAIRAESHWLDDHRWCCELLGNLVKSDSPSDDDFKGFRPWRR